MTTERDLMLSEIRYAERLCQRSARLYRRALWFSAFATALGGSATLTALARTIPSEVSIIGAAVMAVVGAWMFATKPADKAAANEADAKRYALVRARASKLNDQQLRAAIDEAHVSDAPELELLRDVAYNDIAEEVGQPSYKVPLNTRQRILAALA